MVGLRAIIVVFSAVLALAMSSCQLKNKTELYMERGLQFLDNTRELNARLAPTVKANQLGVINDKKERTTNLILKIECPVDTSFFSDKTLVLRGRTKVKRKWKEENWKLPLKAAQLKKHCYIFTAFNSEYAVIDSLAISLHDANGQSLTAQEVVALRVYTKQD